MNTREFIAGVLFLFLGILFFFLSWELPSGHGGSLGPRYWPQLITIGLIILAVILTWSGARSPVKQRLNLKLSDPRQKQLLLGFRKASLILILTSVYIILWSLWSFFILTVFFLFSLMFVLHPEKPVRLFLYSLTIAFLLYASFYWGMRIPFNT